ncbi:hypothetical protein HK405_008584 [Cladochytrium tenue]|nr:hypothetical protein HK405_008584 [Cladochytrium tenue]
MPAQLYYTPTSCAAATFICAHAAGLIASGAVVPHESEIITHRVVKGPQAGADLYDVNAKGNVPALVLENGTVLNENVATLLWVADRARAAGQVLSPPTGTTEWYDLVRKLAFLASELQPALQFYPALTAEQKALLSRLAVARLKYLNDHELAGGKRFLLGDSFTVADAYCYIILTWKEAVHVDLAPFPNVTAYFKHIGELDIVKDGRAAMAAL